MRPASKSAYRLMHEGALAFAEMEAAGMRIDVQYLRKTKVEIEARILRITEKLKGMETYREQRRLFGSKTNLTANPQLAKVLYGIEGHECVSFTKKDKKPQLDEAALERIGTKYCKGFLKLSKLNKVVGTFIASIEREITKDGYAHPSFNLHTVVTYRSSVDSFNSQNIPNREEASARAVRTAFIPRDGHALLEVDIKGAEVMVSACYHKDPTMLQYIKDSHDLHFDMAMECYMLPREQVTKSARQHTKGSFVFAAFYGDYYKQTCQGLWGNAIRYDIRTKDGVSVIDHLKQQGITGLGACEVGEGPVPGTFEAHIKKVEGAFWNERFPVYSQWKKDWFRDYLKKGGFRTLTGFVIEGVFGRNKVINAPAQGSSFHGLLWVIIQLTAWLKKKKMRSKIISQIHDSLIVDAHLNEIHEVGAYIKYLFAEALPRAWKWIMMPLIVDAEVGRKNWYEKEEFAL